MFKKKTENLDNKRDFELKLRQIEKSLEPLINQITTPTGCFGRNKSTSAQILVKFLNESIENFLNNSINVLNENSANILEVQISNEIDAFRLKSNQMMQLSKNFANDPGSSEKRVIMIQRSRELLGYVARILAIADLIDLKQLNIVLEQIEINLNLMKNSTCQEELMTHFKSYGLNFKELITYTKKALNEIKDPQLINELIANRACLTKQNLFLYTSSKTVIQHPQNEVAKTLRDKVFTDAFESIEQIYKIIKRTFNSEEITNLSVKQSPSILNSLDDLDIKIKEMTSTIFYKEIRTKDNLQNQLNETLNNVTGISFANNNTERKNRLQDECNALRKALVDLFNSYGNNNGDLRLVEKKKDNFFKKTKSIRRQLRKAIAEQFNLHTVNQPIDELINAALSGDETILNEQIHSFTRYATKLIESSQLACSMSSDRQGIQMVEVALKQVQTLLPQIVCSARLLCAYPLSNEVNKNMMAYRDTWLNEVEILLLAIDDILSINEFLAVSENLILEDINQAVEALQNQDTNKFKYLCEQINGRVIRVSEIVKCEMDNFELCQFTQNITNICSVLRNKLIPNFSRSVDYAHEALKCQPIKDPNENDFIDASRLIYDGVRDIRNALLLIPNDSTDENEDEEDNLEVRDDQVQPPEPQPMEPEIPLIKAENITKEQREQLSQQLDSFAKEKNNFEREVLKWDDKSNDIVVLAKQICVIMMNMTDFMQGRGPFKTTTDIINAAKQISGLGTNLEKLVKELADECPESPSKRELLGYLKQLPLFCNQLNIASKVKENIIDPDNASSLIISSKNLMTAVISVVQASYVASTKYTSKTGNRKPIVQWKMKPPEKKPLVNLTSRTNEPTGLIRKGSMKKRVEPVKILSEFQV